MNFRKFDGLLRSAAVAVLLAVVGISIPPARAEEPTKLSLGTVAGLPRSEVLVPVLLEPSPPGLQIAEVTAAIRFETKDITFVRAEKSFLLDGVNAGFQANLQNDPADSSRAAVRLEVATKGEPRKSLREGLLVTLVFRINDNATAGTTVPLLIDNVAAADVSSPPKAIQPIAGQEGGVEVIPPEEVPYVPCFFFTH